MPQVAFYGEALSSLLLPPHFLVLVFLQLGTFQRRVFFSFCLQYQHLAGHRRLAYAFQDDCRKSKQPPPPPPGQQAVPAWMFSPHVDVGDVVRAVELYLASPHAGRFAAHSTQGVYGNAPGPGVDTALS